MCGCMCIAGLMRTNIRFESFGAFFVERSVW